MLRLSGTAAIVSALSACTNGTKSVAGSTSPARPASTTMTTGSPRSSAATGVATATAPPSTPSRAPSSTVANGPRTLDQLAGAVSGGLKRRGQAGYDAAALLYNPRFGRQPGPRAIAACRTGADVAACVRFAAAGATNLRIRNGGHSYGGWSSGPGLVADLAAMKSVTFDARTMTATVGAGARLADVYGALAAHGVAIGAGSCPTVGVTGLTLGGGVGVLSRAYGLTCDQVRAFAVVTADGTAHTVDAHTQPELFWALRGGGGGLAAVTSVTFAVRRAPTIVRFFLQWPWSRAADVLAAWQEWTAGAPRELWSTCKLLADPGSGLTATVAGTWIGSGSVDRVLAALLRRLPAPRFSSRHTDSYGATMAAEAGCAGLDPNQCVTHALTPGSRLPFAATSSIVAKALPAAGVAAAVEAVANSMDVAPGVLVEAGISFDALGGAVADVGPGDTAFPWRSALALVQHTATWRSSAAGHDPAPFDGFVRAARKSLAPWTGSSAYVNYADASIANFATAYWGSNLSRLRTVKRAVDPHGVFGFPQSVPL